MIRTSDCAHRPTRRPPRPDRLLPSFATIVSALTLFVAPVAAAGVPVSLPTEVSVAQWADAAAVADVDWVAKPAATVQITDLGMRWELRCACNGAPRSVRVNEPRTAAERLEVAVMARAIGRDLQTHAPPLRMAPPPPVSVQPLTVVQPVQNVEPRRLEVTTARPRIALVQQQLPALPTAPPRPELPTYVPPDRTLTLPHMWVGLGLGLRPQTRPSLRMSGGVTILNGRRLSMSVSGTAITSRSLSGFNKRPWHNRKMWEAGAHVSGGLQIGEWVQVDAGIGATRQAYHQNDRPLMAVTVPQVTADIELRTPGERRIGLRVGGTADLRGVALVDELTTQQQWLVPFEFRTSIVARIGRRADPTRPRHTPTEHRPDSTGLFNSEDLP